MQNQPSHEACTWSITRLTSHPHTTHSQRRVLGTWPYYFHPLGIKSHTPSPESPSNATRHNKGLFNPRQRPDHTRSISPDLIHTPSHQPRSHYPFSHLCFPSTGFTTTISAAPISPNPFPTFIHYHPPIFSRYGSSQRRTFTCRKLYACI